MNKTCSWCNNPIDGEYHHNTCYFDVTRIEAQESGIPFTDAGASQLTFGYLLATCPSQNDKAQLDWSEVMILSHPCQKQILNATALHLEKENLDALETIKSFWDNVTWVTDDDICPIVLSVWYRGNEVHRIIGLSAYGATGRALTGEYSLKHPITMVKPEYALANELNKP